MQRIKRKLRGAARRLVMLPMKLSSAHLRAEALEQLTGEMIADSAISGGTLKFFAPTPLLRSRAENLLTKETDMIRWLDTLGPDSVLWDIGANVGQFTLYAAAQRKVRVLAFEPSASNFHVLARNIALNNLNDRASAFCIALSGRTELGVLNVGSTELGSAMSQFGKPGEISRYWSGGSPMTHGMVGFTVDEFIARFTPAFPTHIKMDVDGLEWPILQGAEKTLNDARLRSVMVELSITDKAERGKAFDFLSARGLKFVSSGEEQGSLTERAANHLFERPASK